MAYTASSVKHALPSSPGTYRERRVKFEDERCTTDCCSFDEKEAAASHVSQEEADLRLAIALQKQENVAAYKVQQKRRGDAVKAVSRRTGRSCAHGFGLSVHTASPERDHTASAAAAAVPKVSYAPVSSIDTDDSISIEPDPNAPAWVKIQRVEKSAAGTAAVAQKFLEEEVLDHGAQRRRSGRSASRPEF